MSIMSHSSGGWKLEIRVLHGGVPVKAGLWLLTVFSHGARGRRALWSPLVRALIPFIQALFL